MTKIATIGCGLIGQVWATVFTQAGFDVVMYDISPEAAEHALSAMEKRVADLVAFDLISPSDAPAILNRLTVVTSLEEALQGVVYIQESGPERIEIKREITERLDALRPLTCPSEAQRPAFRHRVIARISSDGIAALLCTRSIHRTLSQRSRSCRPRGPTTTSCPQRKILCRPAGAKLSFCPRKSMVL